MVLRSPIFRLLSRRKVAAILAALVAFILLSPVKYFVTVTGYVQNVEPGVVWEFVADFSHMKQLNPTIIDFAITSEKGNVQDWEYGVYYTEHLSQLPSVENYAYAKIHVKPLSKKEYLINSEHSTCFMSDLFCLDSWSTMTFTAVRNMTQVVENVTYECPRVFYYFCYGEVMYQREAIIKNLIQNYQKE